MLPAISLVQLYTTEISIFIAKQRAMGRGWDNLGEAMDLSDKVQVTQRRVHHQSKALFTFAPPPAPYLPPVQSDQRQQLTSIEVDDRVTRSHYHWPADGRIERQG
jgi:hypothetical protein